MSLQLIAVVAMTEQRVIGSNGKLPWHLPEDLKFFKKTTTGHPIVMGRSTFESIGRPLPNRRNLVLTRDPEWSHADVEVLHRPNDLFDLGIEGMTFIIGGAQIYQAYLSKLDQLLVSKVHQSYSGDTYFPEFEHQFAAPETIAAYPEFNIQRYQSLTA